MEIPAFTDKMMGRVMVVRPGKLKFVARALPPTAPFDVPARPNDPTTLGATLRISDLDGTRDNGYVLPAKGWTGLDRGYRYRGIRSDPCRSVLITRRFVKARCQGAAVTLPVAYEGDRRIVLQVGSASNRYCALFGGTPRGNPETVWIRTDADAPSSCLP